ncbi:hypothetical protein [Paenibacillus sp. J5C2022]|uniref:hypothetical protein n=1 Tax=Paenibacillus sp. J5C2022 TaxID=2977129 RepID=UPI0021D2BF7D|nr:hypothetical protein [Paenibacillus sp. J5C2022]
MRMARVGILLDQAAMMRRHQFGINVFEAFAGEVLSHAGIPFQWIDHVSDVAEHQLDVLIVACMDENEDNAETIWSFAEQGGAVISYAGLKCLTARLGCRADRDMAAGYASALSAGDDSGMLRFLKAKPWVQQDGEQSNTTVQASGSLRKDEPAGREAGAALLQFSVGEGRIDRWAVNIPYTLVHFQQGTEPVLDDGIPATDGSGAVDEGILKADDRIALDWEYDRTTTETSAPYFKEPYADLWKEAMIEHLLKLVLEQGLTLPFVSYWPDGISYIATISHDSDLNIDESAEATLDTLHDCRIQSTWCMIEPGYSPYIYDKVKQAGHELAFHYNALEANDGKWDEAEFDRQFAWLQQAIGADRVTSNKNHYTIFQGWSELFDWCEKHGIEVDQTRGPSKRGNIGFLFGTCHPYFPVAWFDQGNRSYNVLEISFLTQDLDHIHLADSSVVEPFLEQVMRVEGVAHFLFHQVHILNQEPVNKAIRKVVAEARKRGFTFWTSKQINDWERARRKVRITGIEANAEARVEHGTELKDAVVWIPVQEGAANREIVNRFGVPCVRQVLGAARATIPSLS